MIVHESEVDFEALAKDAYHAYGQVTDFKNYQGLPMPKWEDLTDTIHKAWIAAATSVYNQTHTTNSG